jgi:lipopolysaccharide export system permease protein
MIGVRILDRYVMRSWLLIFGLTALGFPLVSVIINLTDSLQRLLSRGLTAKQILVSYVYALPEHMFEVMPAAVLFATVFTIGNLARNSEITAMKAGGQGFLRLCTPILIAALLASGLSGVLGNLAPTATAKQLELQKAKPQRPRLSRYNFVYRADQGWVYTIRSLDVNQQALRNLVLVRQGRGGDYPSLAIAADSATYDESSHGWSLWAGTSQRVAGPGEERIFRFKTAHLRALTESPTELMAEPKAPQEMRYGELRRYIDALKRSGNDTSKLEVELALKIALPATCFIVAMLGAPLAYSSPRSGPAFGIGISLLATVLFLSLIQLSKAVGTSGVIDPTVAAWVPNGMVLGIALWLLARVRT